MQPWTRPQTVNLVDLGFMDARSKLLDVAAFLDRTQRAGQDDDFRIDAINKALVLLMMDEPRRAEEVLLSLSDPTEQPIARATVQGACGAFKESEKG